jgi:hypothetical protein
MFDDTTGAPVLLPDGVTHANLRTYPISPDADPDSPLTDTLKKMREGMAPDWEYYAYWSPDIIDYVIEESANRYPGNPPSWCKGKDATPKEHRFGLTVTAQLRDVVMMCPDAFEEISEPYETIDIALHSDEAKTIKKPLQSASPRSLTLFHEFIHLTSGVEETKDLASKIF